jgi:hypothetical protein
MRRSELEINPNLYEISYMRKRVNKNSGLMKKSENARSSWTGMPASRSKNVQTFYQ